MWVMTTFVQCCKTCWHYISNQNKVVPNVSSTCTTMVSNNCSRESITTRSLSAMAVCNNVIGSFFVHLGQVHTKFIALFLRYMLAGHRMYTSDWRLQHIPLYKHVPGTAGSTLTQGKLTIWLHISTSTSSALSPRNPTHLPLLLLRPARHINAKCVRWLSAVPLSLVGDPFLFLRKRGTCWSRGKNLMWMSP